jgi:hypothetical protein
MALFIRSNEHSLKVQVDLLNIVGLDKGLQLIDVPTNPHLVQVTYKQSKSGFPQDRINDIANKVPYDVIVMGVDTDYVLPWGQPIIAAAGITVCPVEGGIVGPIIPIIYDVTQAYDPKTMDRKFYYNRAAISLIEIAAPNCIILFHELSHAFHVSKGDVLCTGGLVQNAEAAEKQAVRDENQCRVIYKMPMRDIDDRELGIGLSGQYFECGFQPGECFIATAAYDTPQAAQVDFLRGLRDNLLGSSLLGAKFFESLYAEYYRFSPRVAADMNASPPLKALILKLTVEPVLAFLILVEQYAKGGWQQRDFGNQIEQGLVGFLAQLRDIGLDAEQVEFVFKETEQLKARLEGTLNIREAREPHSAWSNGSDATMVFHYLTSVIEECSRTLEYVNWGLVTPLVLYWSAIAKLKAGEPEESGLENLLVKAIEDWLSMAPIPPAYSHIDQNAMLEDLVLLKGTLFARPSVRYKFGERLLDHFSNEVAYDLRATLESIGYLPIPFPKGYFNA